MNWLNMHPIKKMLIVLGNANHRKYVSVVFTRPRWLTLESSEFVRPSQSYIERGAGDWLWIYHKKAYGLNWPAMAIGAIAIVSLILLSVLVFALASFIAKHRSVAALKLLPGRKPSYLFGNALQLTGEAHGEYYQERILSWQGTNISLTYKLRA